MKKEAVLGRLFLILAAFLIITFMLFGPNCGDIPGGGAVENCVEELMQHFSLATAGMTSPE